MIQDIPAEESLLALLVADPALSIDDTLTPYCLTDHRRELANLLGKVKMDNGVAGYETLRSLGASDDALKLFDIVSTDDPPIESFFHLVKHLRKVATKRRIFEVSKHWHKLVSDPDFDPAEGLDKIERQALGLRDLYSGRQKEGGVRKGGDVKPLMDLLMRTCNRKGRLMGLRSGFHVVDQCFDGFNPGRLYLIGARPSVGKTSMALSMAVNLLDGLGDSQAPTRGMIFTLEMPFDDIQMNLLVIKSRIGRAAMMNGLTKIHLQTLQRCVQDMAAWDYELDDTGGISIDTLVHRARRAHAEKPLQWIIIDYLQLIKGCEKKSSINRQVEIGEVSGKLKALTKELGIPVIALCQLKRQEKVLSQDKGKKVAPRPKLEDLRESGDLEQDADGVVLIDRDQESEDSAAFLIIPKNRFGALHFSIPVVFEAELSRFRPA